MDDIKAYLQPIQGAESPIEDEDELYERIQDLIAWAPQSSDFHA